MPHRFRGQGAMGTNRQNMVYRRWDDPRITVIKVKSADGYYWDTKHGAAIAGPKMLVGTAIGKTLDNSLEGQLVFWLRVFMDVQSDAYSIKNSRAFFNT